MPSVKNPGSLSVGQGALPPKSVEDVSLKNPNRDISALLGHTQDPRKAHMATSIAVVDAGGYFASDEVEGALQEIAGGNSTGRQNGLISGGTFTSVGDVVTLVTPTTVLLNGVLATYSGETVSLPGGAGTYFIFIHGTTGALTATPFLPDLINEPIWITEVVSNGTNVTSSRDARFFVANIDRKLDYTVRYDLASPASMAAESCFPNLTAAFFWLEKYGSTQERKHTVIVRGACTVAVQLTVPVDNVEIRGEGGAQITFGPTSATRVFNVGNHTGFHVENIEFICAAGGGTAVVVGSTSTPSNVTVKGCKFSSGADDWGAFVALSDVTGFNSIVDCIGATSFEAVNITNLAGTLVIEGSNFTGDAAGTGVNFTGDTTLEANVLISGCTFTNFTNGLLDNEGAGEGFANGYTIRDCVFTDVTYGVTVSSNTTHARITDSVFTLNATTGLFGVTAAGDKASVIGCSFTSTRARGTYLNTEQPTAVYITGDDVRVEGCYADNFANSTGNGKGAAVFSYGNNPVVTGCNFTNSQIMLTSLSAGVKTGGVVSGNTLTSDGSIAFDSDLIQIFGLSAVSVTGNKVQCNSSGTANVGYDRGIYVAGGSQTIFGGSLNTGVLRNVTVSGNTVTAPIVDGIGVGDFVYRYSVTSNTVDGYLSAATFNPTCRGIYIHSVTDAPFDGVVSGNSVTRCKYGVLAVGTLADPLLNLTVSGNNISYCALNLALANNFAGRGAAGIAASYCQNLSISGNALRNIGEQINDAGTHGFPTSGAACSSNGILVWNSPATNIVGNTIFESTSSAGGNIYGVLYELMGVGADVTYGGVSIEDNIFNFTATTRGTDNGVAGCRVHTEGVFASNWTHTLLGVSVSGNRIYSSANTMLDRGVDIHLAEESVVKNLVIGNNTVTNYTLAGVAVRAADQGTYCEGVVVSGNSIRGGLSTTADVSSGGIFLDTSTGSGARKLINAVVSNNTLDDLGPTGINVKLGTNSDLEGLNIVGNTIGSATLGGAGTQSNLIWINSAGADITSLNISNNQLYQSQSSSVGSVPACGIQVSSPGAASASFTSISIQGNNIASTDFGVYLMSASVSDKIFEYVRVDNNHIKMIDSGDYSGIHVDCPRHYMRECSFSDNNIDASAGTTGYCISVDCSNDAGAVVNSLVRVCGNQGRFSNYGVKLLLKQTAELITVSNNTMWSDVGTSASALYFNFDVLKDSSVCSNILRSQIYLGATAAVSDTKIEDNQISCLTADTAAAIGIQYVGSTTATRMSISSNRVTTDQASSFGLFLTSSGNASGLKLDRNVIQEAVFGIFYAASATTANFRMSDNTVVTTQASSNGLHGTFVGDVTNLQVDGNNVQGVRTPSPWVSGVTGVGVHLKFSGNLNRASVSRNIVRTVSSQWMRNCVAVYRDVSITSALTWNMLDISDNLMDAKVLSAAGGNDPFPSTMYLGDAVAGAGGDELFIVRLNMSNNVLNNNAGNYGLMVKNKSALSQSWRVVGNSTDGAATGNVRALDVTPINSILSLNIAEGPGDWTAVGWAGSFAQVANNENY